MVSCEQWRETLSAWLDGACNPQEQKEVQDHLDGCPACRAWVEQVEADKQSFISSLMGRQADISQDVMRRVSEMSVEPKEVVAPHRRPSFGLIELLVVVGVIAIMAAIMFPVFARAREKARQSSCLSNIRQLTLATLQFAQEHNDTLPSAFNWAKSVEPYAKNSMIFQCVSVEAKPGTHYAMNPSLSGRKLDGIAKPNQAVLIYEVQNGQPALRHNDGMNVGYVDGHVKWVKGGPPDYIGPATSINPGAPDNNYGLRRRLKLAYDASCEVWVQHVQEAVVAAEQAFYDRGGFVLNSTLSQPVGERPERSAHIEGKVPTAEVGATINALAALGYAARREISGTDLTDQYVTGSRGVTQAEEKLGEVQQREEAARPAQQPPLQEKVSAARQQLGAAQDALFGTEREAALATITATLIERAPQAAVSAGQIGRAWASFVRTVGKVGVVLVWVGLYGLFALPVIAGVVAYRRRQR